jgi:Hypothetical glycosyl hydrolase family 15
MRQLGRRVWHAVLATVLAMSLSACWGQSRESLGYPLCRLWLAIGDSPTAEEIQSVGKRYDVVILNAWETQKMRLLRSLNPRAKILVYKDLASTRSYPGAFDGGVDNAFLPTGVGYGEANSGHPEWFALNTEGQRIEWSQAYPGHWQMAVWDRNYQKAWADHVVDEVVRQGWDGVFADNDFAQLVYYADDLLAGTSTDEQTSAKLRDGLDVMVKNTGERLNAAGKILVPNISEARLTPGRWTSHSRYGGALAEYFAVREPDGEVIPLDSAEWDEMLQQSKKDAGSLLLISHGTSPEDIRTGFAAAALLAHDKTCWMPAENAEYKNPGSANWQDLPIGHPIGPATKAGNGVWFRKFANGWVGVNPTSAPVTMEVPKGMRTVNGTAVHEITIDPSDSAVLVNPKMP